MTDCLRFGDITGFDDAEIIEIDDGEYVVIENNQKEGLSNENEQQNI